MPTIKIRAQLRKDTSALWAAANPILLAGEPGYETDTKKLRIGDGVTAFISLPAIKLSTTDYQALNSILTAMGGLAAANNKLGYFTGASSMSLTDLTAFGRQLIGASNAAAVRTLLTLSTILFADLDPATVITDVETLVANKVANALPTAKAVTDYVDPRFSCVLLADKSVVGASVAQLDFTEFNNASYLGYLWRLMLVKPVTDATKLQMRFSTNGGSSYDAGASDYSQSGNYMEDTVGPANDGGPLSAVMVSSNGRTVGNAAGRLGVRGLIQMHNAHNASAYTEVEGRTMHESSSGAYTVTDFAAKRVVTQDTDAARFSFSAGNIAIGSRIRMYGLI